MSEWHKSPTGAQLMGVDNGPHDPDDGPSVGGLPDPYAVRGLRITLLEKAGYKRITQQQRAILEEMGTQFRISRTGPERRVRSTGDGDYLDMGEARGADDFELESWVTERDYTAVLAMEGILSHKPSPYPGMTLFDSDSGERLVEGVDYEFDVMGGSSDQIQIILYGARSIRVETDESKMTRELRDLTRAITVVVREPHSGSR